MNNYLTLVNDLEEWRVVAHGRIAYVTFNYDTLLEAPSPSGSDGGSRSSTTTCATTVSS